MKLYPTVVDRFLNHPTCTMREDSSRRSLRSTVRLFQNDHPELELHQVTQAHLHEWLGGRLQSGVADSTVKKNLQRVNTLLDWCEWQELIPANPARHLDRVLRLHPQPVREANWLDESQVTKALDFPIETLVDMRDLVVLRLGFTVGLRSQEIRTLHTDALKRLDQERLVIRGKGRKMAQVYVPTKTRELLQEWRGIYQGSGPVVISFRSLVDWSTGERTLEPQWGTGLTQQALGRIVARRTEEAGIRVAPHDMRRTYAGLVQEKVGMEGASAALRHSDVATTKRYIEQRQDAAYQAGKTAGLEL